MPLLFALNKSEEKGTHVERQSPTHDQLNTNQLLIAETTSSSRLFSKKTNQTFSVPACQTTVNEDHSDKKPDPDCSAMFHRESQHRNFAETSSDVHVARAPDTLRSLERSNVRFAPSSARQRNHTHVDCRLRRGPGRTSNKKSDRRI